MCCSHISRVIRYARPYDWACAAFGTAFMPGGYWLMDYLSPLESRRSYKTGMRMMYVLGPMAGFMFMYINSTRTPSPPRSPQRLRYGWLMYMGGMNSALLGMVRERP